MIPLKIGGDIPIGGVILLMILERKFLSDAYLEKSSLLEERAQRNNSRGAMVIKGA
jgi:hypothetical protein